MELVDGDKAGDTRLLNIVSMAMRMLLQMVTLLGRDYAILVTSSS